LRAHRHRQGPGRRADQPSARAAQRPAAGGHHGRPADRLPAGRCGADRVRVRVQRDRLLPVRRDQRPGLRRAAGLHPVHRDHLRAGEPGGGPALRRDRPETEDTMTAIDPAAERTTSLADLTSAGDGDRGTSLWRGALHRLIRNPGAILGAVIVAVFVLIAIFAPLIAPYQPAASQWIGQVTPSDVPGPSPDHPLGLDPFGSDLLTQLLHGARQSLIIGVVSTTL